MADTKLSALTELAAAPASGDELYIRDISEVAASESKRITITNLLSRLPAVTLDGTFDGNSQVISNISHSTLVDSTGWSSVANNYWTYLRGGVFAAGSGARILLYGKSNAAAGALILDTPNVAGDADITRLSISGNLATAVATWSNVTHTGFSSSGDAYFSLAINTPDGMGADGEQLTSGGDSAAMDWAAAGSLAKFKDIKGLLNPVDALEAILNTKTHLFNYRKETEDGKHAITTGDYDTVYAGVLAEEAPWVMHHNGRIFNPVNAFGYTAGAIRALKDKIEVLENKLMLLGAG
uniref:Peptidase S74 domain-containing protein n=1 Tax=viral metagenome TaxID=1070528 RepID=A0A6M3LC69_9ZZZZ